MISLTTSSPASASQPKQDEVPQSKLKDQSTNCPMFKSQISLTTRVQRPLAGSPGTLKSAKSQFGASNAPSNGSVTPPQGTVNPPPSKQYRPVPLHTYSELLVIGFPVPTVTQISILLAELPQPFGGIFSTSAMTRYFFPAGDIKDTLRSPTQV